MTAAASRPSGPLTEQERARLLELETTIALARGRRPSGGEVLPIAQGLPKVQPSPKRGNRNAEPADVYRLYDRDRQLLYVGVSLSVAQRLGSHRSGQPWWQDVVRIEITHYPNRQKALRAEAAFIRALQPLYNKAGQA